MGKQLTNQNAAVVATKPSAIVGTIRFSMVLEDSNFFPPLSGQGYTERKERIFDRARLEQRFELFENVCLPSLANQSDPDFNVILVTSQALPDWAFDRLMNSIRGIPNMYVRAYRPAANIRRIYKRSVFEMLAPEAPICASFRLDDDDAVATDYIARLRAYMNPENIGKAVTFSKGHLLALAQDNLMTMEDTRPCGSAGLALIQKGGVQSIPETTSIHCLGGHRKVGQYVPVIVDDSAFIYVQTANGVNVSARHATKEWDQISSARMAQMLAEGFPHLCEKTLEDLHESCAS